MPDSAQISNPVSHSQKKVRRAMRLAAFNAWTFAILTVASALLLFYYFSWAGLLITLALGIVAAGEFRGRRLLRQLDVAGARVLGWNQLFLLAAIVVYCGWSIAWGYLYPSPLSQALEEHPQVLENYSQQQRRNLEEELVLIEDLWPTLVACTYGAIILASVIVQGGNAWYNFSRAKHVRECRRSDC